MRIDRAMAFLLEGFAVQRAAWVDPENRRIENIGGRFCFAGTEIVFTRPIPYIRQVYLNMYDMEADDWQIIHHHHSGDQVEDPLAASTAVAIQQDEVKSDEH